MRRLDEDAFSYFLDDAVVGKRAVNITRNTWEPGFCTSQAASISASGKESISWLPPGRVDAWCKRASESIDLPGGLASRA
ncbi:Hypothetical predicted protein [Podarcis lilfordi]|uniref:Uncharacterized protein n=1 Tax=Podarcis lilfordi TaxID=74358 RepID=A0AA35LMS0_9SAUR|nr:Hypothetical predicted protein [Podarcis lilfordi]